MPAAFAAIAPALSPDELAWLATLPDVESRLVFTDRIDGQIRYRVQNGPFSEAELAGLPTQDWTLLVQDVEKHLPDFRQLVAAFDFIPDWRIDDLMVSCAAPGGSVGPHKDNYDVFLCQGGGQRNWTITDIESGSPDLDSKELSLLKPFTPAATHKATQGDVLYLPPGVPHWGIAQSLCLTYSIGMRAPSQAELIAAANRLYATSDDLVPQEAAMQNFYHDPDLKPAQAEPGRISAAAIDRLARQNLLSDDLNRVQLATVLGSVCTDNKAWLAPEMPGKKMCARIRKDMYRAAGIRIHGMARIAFCEIEDSSLVFANGFVTTTTQSAIALIKKICLTRVLAANDTAIDLHEQATTRLIDWLIEHGVFDIER